MLIQVFAVHQLVDGVNQTVADGQPLEVDFDLCPGVVEVDGVRHSWHVLARVRLASHVEIVVLVLVEQREKLNQGNVHVATDGCLVDAVTFVVGGEAVPCAHWVVQVYH